MIGQSWVPLFYVLTAWFCLRKMLDFIIISYHFLKRTHVDNARHVSNHQHLLPQWLMPPRHPLTHSIFRQKINSITIHCCSLLSSLPSPVRIFCASNTGRNCIAPKERKNVILMHLTKEKKAKALSSSELRTSSWEMFMLPHQFVKNAIKVFFTKSV